MSRSLLSWVASSSVAKRSGRATSGVIEALERFHSRALKLGARSLTVVATEPLRRAKDRSNVVKEIRGRLGLEPIVLEHEEEGLLTVLGLIHPHDRSTPIIVGDIGGGSTEIVRLTPGARPWHKDSRSARLV